MQYLFTINVSEIPNLHTLTQVNRVLLKNARYVQVHKFREINELSAKVQFILFSRNFLEFEVQCLTSSQTNLP